MKEPTEEQLEKLATRVHDMVIDTLTDGGKLTQIVTDDIARDIGKSVVRKALWILGIGVVALLAWLATKFGVKEVG